MTIRYTPIDTGTSFNANVVNLDRFHCEIFAVFAEFRLPSGEGLALLVSFDNSCIVRLLDQMALSTEGDRKPCEGLVSDNFAYVVEGDPFASQQSELWREVNAPVRHYRFLTQATCVDVLSGAKPSFKVKSAGWLLQHMSS